MALFQMQRFMNGEGSNDGVNGSQETILRKLHEKATAKERQTPEQPGDEGKQERQIRILSVEGVPAEAELKKKTSAEPVTPSQKKGPGGTSTKKKTKKKGEQRKSLAPEVILKRLHAKAKKRENTILSESTDIGDGIAAPTEEASADPVQRAKTSPPQSRRGGDLVLKSTDGGVSGEGGQNEVQSSSGPKGKRKPEAVGEYASGKKKMKKKVAGNIHNQPDKNSSTEQTPHHSKTSAETSELRKISPKSSEHVLSLKRSENTSSEARTVKKRKPNRSFSGDDDKVRKRLSCATENNGNVEKEGTDVKLRVLSNDSPDDNDEGDSSDEDSEEILEDNKNCEDPNTPDDFLNRRANDLSTPHRNEITSQDKGRSVDGDDIDDIEGSRHARIGASDVSKTHDEDIEDNDKETEMETGQLSPTAGNDRDDVIGSDKKDDDDGGTEKGFALLGGEKSKKKQKATRVLPDWLARPMLIEHDLTKHSIAVEEMKQLDSRLVKGLLDEGISHLFPVQRHVIPVILDSVKLGIHVGDAGFRPRDLCVSAPTGSGKTLAFALPIVQALLDRVVPRIRALVVLPTRDLAQQVTRVFTSLCKGTDLRPTLIGGVKKFAQEQRMLVQTSNGETQCDIVVATPGRLVDHINKTQGFTFQYLRFLVIDEADRMMEQISKDWIAQVEKCAFSDSRPAPGPITVNNCAKVNMPLQKLLFSATLSQNPEKLIQLNLFQPRLITSVVTAKNSRRDMKMGREESIEERGEFVGKYTTPVGLIEYYIQCTPGEKPLVVLHLIRTLNLRQILCFVNTVEATHRLYHLIKLVGGVEVAEFSSNQTAGQRRQILKQFKTGKVQLLICSDAMARGMDVENAKYVISYDMPPYIKTYIHRVGRTARAGKTGVAFSLLQHYEVPKLLKMLKHAGKTNIQKHNTDLQHMDCLVESYEKALQKLPGVLRMEQSYSA